MDLQTADVLVHRLGHQSMVWTRLARKLGHVHVPEYHIVTSFYHASTYLFTGSEQSLHVLLAIAWSQ